MQMKGYTFKQQLVELKAKTHVNNFKISSSKILSMTTVFAVSTFRLPSENHIQDF